VKTSGLSNHYFGSYDQITKLILSKLRLSYFFLIFFIFCFWGITNLELKILKKQIVIIRKGYELVYQKMFQPLRSEQFLRCCVTDTKIKEKKIFVKSIVSSLSPIQAARPVVSTKIKNWTTLFSNLNNLT